MARVQLQRPGLAGLQVGPGVLHLHHPAGVCAFWSRGRRALTASVTRLGGLPGQHPAHAGAREELRTGLHRLAQQVDVQGVLGADVAARHAVATQRAGRQVHAGGVRPVCHGHRDGQHPRLLVPARQPVHGLRLGQRLRRVRRVQGYGVQLWPVGPCTLGPQGHAGPLVPALVSQGLDLGLEVLTPQVLRVRLQHHPGIDERAATHAVGHQGHDVFAHAQVEQTFGLAARFTRGLLAHAQVAGQVGHPGGELARPPFLPALEDAQAQRTALA